MNEMPEYLKLLLELYVDEWRVVLNIIINKVII